MPIVASRSPTNCSANFGTSRYAPKVQFQALREKNTKFSVKRTRKPKDRSASTRHCNTASLSQFHFSMSPSQNTPAFGALVISLDFELHWGVRDKRPVDGSYRENLLGAREAIPRMLDLFEEFGIAATWATVGFL